MRLKSSKGTQKHKHTEFSKHILALVMVTYFVGVIIGGYIALRIVLLYPDAAVSALCALLSYIGAPVAVSIGFYSWKSKAENCRKIDKNVTAETVANITT